MTDRTKLQEELFGLQDLKYRDFHSKLMPNVEKEKVCRMPHIRSGMESVC